MALSHKKLQEKREKLFPKLEFHGRDPTAEYQTEPDPIPLDTFLMEVRKRFPRVPLKKLHISFNDFGLTVTHVTDEAREKEKALFKGNSRVYASVHLSEKAALAVHRMRLFDDEGFSRDELIGNLVEERIKTLKPENIVKNEGEPSGNVFNPLVPEKAYDEVRRIAHVHQISRSAIINHLLEEWVDEQKRAAQPA